MYRQFGDLFDRNLSARGCRDQRLPQCREILAKLPWIADVDGIPFEPFDRGRNVRSTQGREDDLLYMIDRHPVSRDIFTFDLEVDV